MDLEFILVACMGTVLAIAILYLIWFYATDKNKTTVYSDAFNKRYEEDLKRQIDKQHSKN